MNISKLYRYPGKALTILGIILLTGCSGNPQKAPDQAGAGQAIDFKALKADLYDHLTIDILKSSPLKDTLENLDSAIMYVVPVKKCFSCLDASMEEINADTNIAGISKILVIVEDSVDSYSTGRVLKRHKNFKHVVLKDHFSSRYGLLEISKIHYIRNGKSTLDVLD